MSESVNTRELVLEMLIEILEKGSYSHLVLRQVLEKYQYLDKKDRAFMTRLTEGTLERLLELDFLINSFSKTKVKKMKPLIRELMRMSVYQLKYMDAVPDSAVCNEAVKLAKKHGFASLSGFVNGVLRNMARSMDQVKYPDPAQDAVSAMEIRYSVPAWILIQWIRDYGAEQTEKILEGISVEYPLTIRTNTLRIAPADLKKRLEEEGVTAQPTAVEYAFAISGFDYLESLTSFREGLFYVQDVSSMMAAEAAAPKPGDYVIDVCAAPGGKSTHMAEMMKGTGTVEARDLTEYKVSQIRDNISRHGLTNMKAVCMDATVFDPESVEKADVLMCDLPCSGLGVLGKKTDIRYRESPEQEGALADLQKKILNTVWSYVKRGGTLVYSTCTVDCQENEENVDDFLREHPQFSLVNKRQIFPGEMGQDGFFIAKMIRSEEA